jgi:hypothetical protein
MKSFRLCLVIFAASCAHKAAPPPSTAKVPIVRDASKADPEASVMICERDTLIGSNIMDVHCRRKADIDMEKRERDMLGPAGLGETNIPGGK